MQIYHELMTHEGEMMTVEGVTSWRENKVDKLSFHYFSGDPQSVEQEVKVFNQTARPMLQMIFVLKGTIKCQLNGLRKQILTITNQQHNLIMIPNRDLIWEFDALFSELVMINLSVEFLSRYLPAAHIGHQNLNPGSYSNEPSLFSNQHLYITPEINAILFGLQNSSHQGFCSQLFLEAKVIELLVLQISQQEVIKNNNSCYLLNADALEKMHEVRDFLITNEGGQLSLKELAHKVGTNEFNLKKHFKAAFGITVFGYLNQHKMESAKAILIRGESKIAEVSAKMGYKHATHFTSAFKKYFGYLPTKLKVLCLIWDPEFFISELLVYFMPY